MATAGGAFSSEGGDPRLDSDRVEELAATRPQQRKAHDPSVSFEEYLHYAKIARAEEDASSKNDLGDTTFFSLIVPPKNLPGQAPVYTNSPGGSHGEKAIEAGSNPKNSSENLHNLSYAARSGVSDDEWTNASRAMRTATWAAIFYLITTDILGPFGVPFAMGTLGWGPGIALYTVFGGLAV